MKPEQNFKLEIKRFINAPPARVYKAWTDPAQLKQWFGPGLVQTRQLVADVRVGGNFRWDLTDPDGNERTHQGEYRELVPNEKIVFTWTHHGWENYHSLVTIELAARENGTELRLTHEQLPSETERDGHRQGWGLLLNNLERFCAT